VVYSPRRSLFEAVTQLGRSSSALGAWGVLLDAAQRQTVAALIAPVTAFRRGEPLALMPFTFVR